MIGYLRRKMIIDTKPIVLKLYFRNRKDYIKVYVWKELKYMLIGTGRSAEKFCACYLPDDHKKLKRNKDMRIGEVHFCAKTVNEAIVSHELLHVIFDAAWKLGQNIIPPSPYESSKSKKSQYCEFLCYEIENLTRSFWTKYRNKSR
jgi:hypothetical protein